MTDRQKLEAKLVEAKREVLTLQLGQAQDELGQVQQITVQSDAKNALANWDTTTKKTAPVDPRFSGMPGVNLPQPQANKTIEGLGKGKDLNKTIGLALGIDGGKIDTESGSPARERLLLELLPTDADKEKFLRNIHGDENVKLVNLNGNIEKFVTDPKTGTTTMVDELGFSGKDLIDMGSEGLTAAAAILAIPTGGGSVLGTALAMGAASAVVGVGLDVIGRKTLLPEESLDPWEIAKRRGKEAAVGLGIDLALPGIGKSISRAITKPTSKNIVNEYTKKSFEATQRLSEKYNKNLDVLLSNPDKMSKAVEGSPSGMLAQRMANIRDTSNSMWESLSGNVGSKAPSLHKSLRKHEDRVIQKVGKLKDKFKETESDVVDYLQQKLKRDFDAVAGTAADDPSIIGKFIQDKILGNLKDVKNKATEMYEVAYKNLDAAGHKVKTKRVLEVAAKLRGGKHYKRISPADQAKPSSQDLVAKQIGQVMGVGKVSSLKVLLDDALMNGSMSFRKLDEIIRLLRKESQYNPAKGVNPDERALKEMTARLTQFRESEMSRLPGKPGKLFGSFQEDYAKANAYWNDSVKPFKSSVLRSVYSREADEFVSGGVAAMNKALSSRENIDAVLKAAGENAPEVKKALARHFWDTKGIYAGSDKYVEFIINPADREILKRLGVLPDHIAAIQRLSKISQEGHVTMQNARELIGGIKSYKEKRALNEKLASLKRQQIAIDNKVASTLFGKNATLTGVPQMDDLHEYVDLMLNKSSSATTIEKIVGAQNSIDKQSLRQSTFQWLFNKTQKQAQRTSKGKGEGKIFNPKAMRNLMSGNERRLRAMVGNKEFDELADIVTRLDSASVTPIKTKSSGIGSISSNREAVQGKGLIDRLIVRPLDRVSSSIMSAMYGSGILSKFTKGELRGIDFTADGHKLTNLYWDMLMTSEGIHALAIEADKNHWLLEWLLDDSSKFSQENGSFNPLQPSNN